MTANSTIPVHRDDGELLGYLEPVAPPELWQPCTVFGYPMGEATSRDEAEEVLQRTGLSYLAERWEVLEGTDSEGWLRVDLVEVSPARVVTMVVDYGAPERYGERITLTVPVGSRLRRA